MAFFGLQPITDKIKLPQFIRSKLAIREMDNAAIELPCFVVSSTVAREYTIPTEPVDSNQHVSDTIINNPLTISLELFVYENSSKEFFEILHNIQAGSRGFVFTDRKGVEYGDLYMTAYSVFEDSNQLGAFNVSVDLQQVMRVRALESVIVKLPTPAGEAKQKGTASAEVAGTKGDAGTQGAQNRSMLKQLTNDGKGLVNKLVGTILG